MEHTKTLVDTFIASRAEKYGGEWQEAYEGLIEAMNRDEEELD